MNKSANSVADTATALRKSLPQRLRAAGIHVGISAIIFGAALYLILVRWYPGFHFTVDGGWQGVRIMAAVDLVLGPTLTLIVFNPFKARHLIVFDLTCIGLTQLGALVWGFYAVHLEHPVAVSYEDGTFHSVIAAPLEIEKFSAAQLAELSDRRPALVYVAPAVSDGEQTRAAMQELLGKVASFEDPFFFRRFLDHWSDVRLRALAPAQLAKDAAFAAGLPAFLERHGGQRGDYAFFPFEGRYGRCTLAFTPQGELIDALGCEKL